MIEPTPLNQDSSTGASTEYTQEQYEAYLKYQEEQERLATGGGTADPSAMANPTSTTNPTPVSPTPVSPTTPIPTNVNTAPTASGEKSTSTAATAAAAKAKESASASKETAAAMLGEVKSAVSGASKREPYAFLALASAAFAVIWLLYPENGDIGAQNIKLWTVFVLASVALLFTPIVKKVFRLDPLRAWQFAVAGASGLGFAWVAFLLPSIDSNQAFFGTLAAAAGGLAAWTAPGRPE
jgi:hypothetical protein